MNNWLQMILILLNGYKKIKKYIKNIKLVLLNNGAHNKMYYIQIQHK